MLLVSQASSGTEAIQQFQEHRPDVTLMDLRLPDLGGIDAMIAIRAQFPEARIIMLTTSELEEDIFQAIESGAAGYLLKTAQRAELADAIRRVRSGGRAVPAPVPTPRAVP